MYLRGSPTVSAFRRDKLLQEMRAIHTGINAIAAEHIHFVDLLTPVEAEQHAVLESILRYGPVPTEYPPAGQLQLVLPRPGTISPWSSKATDIAHVCGLHPFRGRVASAVRPGATRPPHCGGPPGRRTS